MVPELNWCGETIRPGEGYGGKPEYVPETPKPVQVKAKPQPQHYAGITEADLAEVFDHGAYELPRALAAKLLEAHTGTHRTNCYKALRLNGRLPGISAPRVKPFPGTDLTSKVARA
jgi:hypothetical protein